MPIWIFTLKTALHARHNLNLPNFVAFVDRVKAFDTIDHGMMMVILKRYGSPPRLRSAIAHMYADLKIGLRIGKVKANTKQIIGVIQGDCVALVLFLFMM